jgi:thiamine biosynthesis lipoprotein ApbE
MLQLADKCFKLSNGFFDPTVLPLALLWKSCLSGGVTPTEQQIIAVQGAILA